MSWIRHQGATNYFEIDNASSIFKRSRLTDFAGGDLSQHSLRDIQCNFFNHGQRNLLVSINQIIR